MNFTSPGTGKLLEVCSRTVAGYIVFIVIFALGKDAVLIFVIRRNHDDQGFHGMVSNLFKYFIFGRHSNLDGVRFKISHSSLVGNAFSSEFILSKFHDALVCFG